MFNSNLHYSSYKGSSVTLLDNSNNIVGFFRGIDFIKYKDHNETIGTIFIPYIDSTASQEEDLSKNYLKANKIVIDFLNDFGNRFYANVDILSWRNSTPPLFELKTGPVVHMAGSSDFQKRVNKYLESL